MTDRLPMIEIRDLNRRFGDLQAVRNLNLTVGQGELFCFLGPNGAGKTTTIKMLCGLLKPTRGTLRIGGFDLQRDVMPVRRISAYIPDTPFLYERLTAVEFYNFVGQLYRLGKTELEARRESSLDQLGLTAHAHVLIKDLSHGFRQRLIYATAFLQDPRVLFVDEPFVGLDPASIRLIKDLLRQKARDGMTVFLTTHILALAEDLADRVGILQNGELVALGSLAELSGQTSGLQRLEDIFMRITEGDGDKSHPA